MDAVAKQLEDSLLVIWNERDSEKRVAAMKGIYAPTISFFESHEGPAITGFEAIDALIAKLQQQWAPTFSFELTAPSRENHQVQLVTWRLGNPGEPAVATGRDIAIIENGKISSLHLLLD